MPENLKFDSLNIIAQSGVTFGTSRAHGVMPTSELAYLAQ